MMSMVSRHIIYYTLHVVRPALLFFFNDTATTEIYTLSLHDALPICTGDIFSNAEGTRKVGTREMGDADLAGDRKSTRLNSSHSQISYAVFCLKKKKTPHKKRKTINSTTQGCDGNPTIEYSAFIYILL